MAGQLATANAQMVREQPAILRATLQSIAETHEAALKQQMLNYEMAVKHLGDGAVTEQLARRGLEPFAQAADSLVAREIDAYANALGVSHEQAAQLIRTRLFRLRELQANGQPAPNDGPAEAGDQLASA